MFISKIMYVNVPNLKPKAIKNALVKTKNPNYSIHLKIYARHSVFKIQQGIYK